MPQDQFYGFPKRGLEPNLWHPRVMQTSAGFDLRTTLPLRKPWDVGTTQVIGQCVVASAQVVLDAGGSGNNTVFMELPYALVVQSGGPGTSFDFQNVGTFYFERPGGNMYVGIVQGFIGGNRAIFRSGIGVSANGFGNGPSITLAAGDVLALSLSYFANV